MNPGDLDDQQLLNLAKSIYVRGEIRKALWAELKKRQLPIPSDMDPDSGDNVLTRRQKFMIILFPFVHPFIGSIFTNRTIYGNNQEKLNAHWKYAAIGYGIYTLVIVIAVKIHRVISNT